MANPTKLSNESGEWLEVEMSDEEVARLNELSDENDKDISSIRPHRDQLLLTSDWTISNDSPLTTAKQDEWKTYRQNLRDLPAAYTRVSAVVWPTPPE
ncbi:MAG: hypothetical protein CBB70_05445 [Planctomycetaceae bacterium TMED10]|nr:MAG: hypothetical protein CBB70_05445 [Planctomycetaceae bacterium TMED10]|tara:strand:+ start:131 stop:424 length:294 start_codon:yes stop_codon:yes gene_type:complete